MGVWEPQSPGGQVWGTGGSQGATARGNAPERVNWWLRLTSSGWETAPRSLDERERARRSRLASWIILGLLVADVLVIPIGFGDVATLIAIAAIGVGVLVAALLNRTGHVTGAGILIVLVLVAGIMGSLLSETTGLTLDSLPAYDLFAIGVVVAASVLPPVSAFVVAAFNSVVMCLDFFLQPHNIDLRTDIQSIGTPLQGSIALLARPIALQVIIAVVAYLWVRGIESAIRRADRAEEIAALEHSIADQKRQLDIGIQQILQTHIRAANGDFTARAPLGQENVLWQIAASLNNLLARLQRAGQAEHQLRRTEEELARLAAAIDDAQAGRRPIWPAPSGTAADLIIERINRGARPASRIGRPSDRPPAEPLTPSAAPPSQGFGAPSSQGFGVGTPSSQGFGQGFAQGLGQGFGAGAPSSQGFGTPLPPLGMPAGQSEALLDEWERQQTDQMPINPWVFPPEAEERP